MLIAIHQPNYLPWLGYFHKIACARAFVFLEGAQFSKGSYTNRVRILYREGPRWLTQAVLRQFGQPIRDLTFADAIWATKHLDTLRNAYRDAPAFAEVWPAFQEILLAGSLATVAEANRRIIIDLAVRLELGTIFFTDTALEIDGRTGNERLVALVKAFTPGSAYLSGAGGRKYEDETKFTEAGIPLIYDSFEHPVYDQGHPNFEPGLSIVDALFHLGWEGTRRLIAR